MSSQHMGIQFSLKGRPNGPNPLPIVQGNGTGLHIWAAVSTPLFQILTKEGFIAQVICAMSRHQQTMAGFGFVDHIDLCITDLSHNGAKVVQRIQDLVNMWVGLLQAMGVHLYQKNASGITSTIDGKTDDGNTQTPHIHSRCQNWMIRAK